MPLIQDSPNKRFGLSHSWTQKRSMWDGRNLFLIRRGSMQKWDALFLNQNKFVQNGENLFLIRERSMLNGLDLFLNQNKFVQNGENLFLTQKRSIQNGGNGYGVETWKLYLYWYPIWRTASSTADWSAVRWTKKTYSSACVSIKPSFKSCLLSAAS